MSEARGYADYLATRGRLVEALGELAGHLEALRDPGRARALVEAARRLEEDSFRLMVVGEFKRGKSTFINALLGEPLLPARLAPCTGVITVLRHGEVPEAFVISRAGERLRVPVGELRRYVVMESADGEDFTPAPHQRVELAFPLALLRNNVELIDSPGLNEHQVRTDVALDWLPRADALLMVLSAEMALSRSELDFLDEQVGAGERADLFFLWNRVDVLAEDPAELAALRARSDAHLRPRVGEAPRVFEISARDALAARRAGDAERLGRSGLPAFEAALEDFLARERGRVKVSGPLHQARHALRRARAEGLPRAEALLREPVASLAARARALEPQLADARRLRQRALDTVARRQRILSEGLRAALTDEVTRLNRRMREESHAVELRWFDVADPERARRRLQAWARPWLAEALRRVEDEVVAPRVAAELSRLSEELNAQLGEWLADLDAMREVLTPGLRLELGPEGEPASAVQRTLGALGGLLLGEADAVIDGGPPGVQGLLRGLPVYLATAAGLALVGASGGLALAAFLGVGLLRSVVTGQDAAERLREQACQDFARRMDAALPPLLDELDRRLAEAFEGLSDALGEGTRALLDELEAQVAEALRARAEGERALSEALARLDATRAGLDAVEVRLDGIAREIGA